MTKNEIGFLVFFTPLFCLKFFEVGADDILLKLVGVGCFFLAAIHISHHQYNKCAINVLIYLFLFSSLLVFTCGKQGAFFSVLMLIMMYGVNMDARIYKILLRAGILFFLMTFVYSYGNKEVEQRYINGMWVDITKRSNILFVNYCAVISLYLLVHRQTLKKLSIVFLFVSGVMMSYYTGSRSGLVLAAFWTIMLLLFRYPQVKNNNLIKCLCIYSPLYCFIFCVYTGIAFGKHEWLDEINALLQGRVEQNYIFMENYMILPFGQHITEGGDVNGEYLNLDCAYLYMLLCEGFLFAILWVVFTIVIIRYFYNRNAMVEVSILVMYAFYGITETFLPNCFLNVSLFLYGEYFYKHYLRKKTSIISISKQ